MSTVATGTTDDLTSPRPSRGIDIFEEKDVDEYFANVTIGPGRRSITSRTLSSILSVPSDGQTSSKSGLYYTTVRRLCKATALSKCTAKFEMLTISSRNKTENVMMRAEGMPNKRGYYIYNLMGETEKLVGSLECVSSIIKSLTTLVYSLKFGQDEQACFVYTVPSNWSKLTSPMAVRELDAIIMSCDDATDTSSSLSVKKQSVKADAFLHEMCTKEVQSNGNIKSSTSGNAIAMMFPTSITLRNKQPYKKSNGRFGLDFYGRGQMTSSKNMQVICSVAGSSVPDDELTPVVMQMVKVDKQDYHVDFRAPLNCFQAFGFALAQFDLY